MVETSEALNNEVIVDHDDLDERHEEFNAPATVANPASLLAAPADPVEMILAQRQKVVELMKRAMTEGVHYGVIPRTGGKKSLFQPGADLLIQLRNASATVSTIERRPLDGDHYLYHSQCAITSPSGCWTAEGTCSSKEKQYRKNDPNDIDNTVCKMAHKRAKVAAALLMTGASDLFTQDIEDLAKNGVLGEPKDEGVKTDHRSPDNSGTISSEKMRQIHALAKDHGWDHDTLSKVVQKRFNVASTRDLTNDQAAQIVKGFKEHADAARKAKRDARAEGEALDKQLDNIQFDGLDKKREVVRDLFKACLDRKIDTGMHADDVANVINDSTEEGTLNALIGDFSDLLEKHNPEPATPDAFVSTGNEHFDMVKRIDASDASLNDWERGFVESIMNTIAEGKYDKPTEKQADRIEELADKYLS